MITERVVGHLGKSVAIRLVKATKDVEEGGGMFTNVSRFNQSSLMTSVTCAELDLGLLGLWFKMSN